MAKERIVFVESDSGVFDALAPYAKARGITPGLLASRILRAVARDGLADAVLDDDGEGPKQESAA